MKVLVISHNSFSSTHNNGKTLSSIFSCFRNEELCQLFFTPIGKVDYDRCNQYYIIDIKDALKSIIARWNCGYEVKESKNITKNTGKRKLYNRSLLTQIARDVIFYFSSWYRGGFNKWLMKQNPDLVFYVGGDAIFSHIIAVRISNLLNKPLLTYFTDDYVLNPPSSIYLSLLKHYYKTTIHQSVGLYAIGEKMARDYSAYYSRTFYPIMNIVDIPKEMPSPIGIKDTITINYFGGLHLGRDSEIVRFGEFIRKNIEPKINYRIKIGVYTFSCIEEVAMNHFSKLGISIYKGLLNKDLKDAMSNTHIFLHIESIEKQYRNLTKLSISTKIPEYMSLAKPIIAFGPSDVASFEVISKANPILVIDDSEYFEENIFSTICCALNSPTILNKIAQDNYMYARDNFDKEIVSEKFRSQLCSFV